MCKLSGQSFVARLRLTLCIFLLSLAVPGAGAQAPNMAPQGANGLTMSLYPVERGPDGQQYITTPKGFKVTVPGVNIAADAHEVAVYRNDQNQFWYVDRNGVTQPVNHNQLQWTVAQIQNQMATRNLQIEKNEVREPYGVPPGVMPGSAPAATLAVPGAMPVAAPGMMGTAPQSPSTIVVNNQQPASNTSGSSGTKTALVSGLAAAGGAMAGWPLPAPCTTTTTATTGCPMERRCIMRAINTITTVPTALDVRCR